VTGVLTCALSDLFVFDAGTGMFIAAVLLDSPSLAVVPLMYGLVMNLPAFILIALNAKKDH
jgi:BASS family bile acid:Na+ symporter